MLREDAAVLARLLEAAFGLPAAEHYSRLDGGMTITVVAHDPDWEEKYARESRVVESALGPAIVAVHHIGSTAIPGIWAKPIIDMLVEATSVDEVDQRARFMVEAGYEVMGEFGIPGRRYFRKDSPAGVRAFHVHVFSAGTEAARRHLAFRDYLRAHPDVAREYSDLKRRLAVEHPDDMQAYMDGKDPFIKATERAAVAWWRRPTSSKSSTPRCPGCDTPGG